MQKLPQLDALFQDAAKREAIPGVVAVAASDSEIIYKGAFGKRDLGKPDAMTLDSVFWIASMTKAVTTAGAMQLVEAGKLQLDEPIGRLIPELASLRVLDGFDESGAPKLRPAKNQITLRQLMTHTSGFCYDMWNADMSRYYEAANLPRVISCEKRALSAPLASEPGTRWEYSISIDFVGQAIEAASGKRLDAYLRDHIFAPLGMKDTSFKLSDDQRKRLVGMHARQPDGSLVPMPFEMPQEPEFHMGGGGLYSTAHDYIRFVRMILNKGTLDGNRVLKPETVATMAQNQIGELNMTKMHAAIPQVTNDVDLYPDQDKKWGLSFMINTQQTAEGRSAGSLAWAGLANTYYWIDPTRNVGGVILTQLFPFADKKVLELFGGFERAIYDKLDGMKRAA
ncbi:MAG TPA: serine hydrolase domain-containing protein [Beijerinckiaceae bacterium]|nr:serine hydrolase domain-containing protein [Beijerinckiaceae bacterium]